MRLSRVYIDAPLKLNALVHLPKETAHYLGNVLRLRVDDELLLFNSQHGEFLARICAASKKSLEVELIEVRRELDADDELNRLGLHLILGLSRGDRMDFAVQKSTELGVTEISPVYTEHGEVRLKPERLEKKLLHWRRIAISACEQSGRLTVPSIHSPIPLADLAQGSSANKWMLEPSGSDSIPESLVEPVAEPMAEPTANRHIDLLIGPEGGFSPAEIDWARDNGFRIVSLGKRILRTETAPIAALAILQHKFGDM